LEALRALKRHLAQTVFGLLRQQPTSAPLIIKVRGGKVRPPFLPEAAVVVLMPVRSQPEGMQQSVG
jgi:hypothetical protein